jgi:CRP-like cAMP-binding protein
MKPFSDRGEEAMNDNDLIRDLRELRFLHGIEAAHLAAIANIAQISELRPRDVVFREGDTADRVFLVVSGRLSLELSPATAYRKQLVTVGPGEMLGWSTLVESPRYAATAIAVEPTRLIQIDGARLRLLCSEDPRLGYEFMRRTMRALAKRLTETWRQLSYVYLSHNVPVSASNVE